jgi:hypothetical protein
MRRKSGFFVTLLLSTTAVAAQTPSSDSQMTQAMLMEIRQLRQDLQATGATIQRVAIVMYRLQAQTALLDRATGRLDYARDACDRAREQRKMTATLIERAEARRRSSQNPSDQRAEEDNLAQLKSQSERWAGKELQCQVEQADAETQFRAEQAKMNDLQDQLEKLDKLLAGPRGR